MNQPMSIAKMLCLKAALVLSLCIAVYITFQSLRPVQADQCMYFAGPPDSCSEYVVRVLGLNLNNLPVCDNVNLCPQLHEVQMGTGNWDPTWPVNEDNPSGYEVDHQLFFDCFYDSNCVVRSVNGVDECRPDLSAPPWVFTIEEWSLNTGLPCDLEEMP